MPKEEWFEKWFGSPYYRVLYSNRDTGEAKMFIDNLIRFLALKDGSRLLDIACGEGRHARQLAAYGYDVTGIDLSDYSITKAKEFENEHLQFFRHDMRLPFFVNYFDAAFNFFTSFGYFRHYRDNFLAAKSFAKSLKPGGILVVDYLNAVQVIRHMKPDYQEIREHIHFNISKRLEGKHLIKHISFIDELGAEHNYTERVSMFDQAEFIKIFSVAGMSLEQSFGNYDLESFDEENSPRLIMVFRKNGR